MYNILNNLCLKKIFAELDISAQSEPKMPCESEPLIPGESEPPGV